MTRYAIYCLLLLGMGLSGILYWWAVVASVAILIQKPKWNWGWLVIPFLIPFCLGAEVEQDSIMYDVPLALRHLAHHSINFTPENSVGQWMHMSDLILCIMPEHGRIISCLCVTACCVIVYDMISFSGAGRVAWLGPVLVLCAPGMMKVCGSSKYDAVSLLFCFMAASAFLREKMFTAGLAIGCACVCKLTAVPLAFGMALFGGWRIVAGMSTICLPWMARQWLTMGNPFFPVYGSAFSENWYPHIRKVEMQMNYAAGKTPQSIFSTMVWLSPLTALFVPFSFGGSMVLVGLIGVMGNLYLLQNNIRYLLPCLPFLIVPAMASANIMVRGRKAFAVYTVFAILLTYPQYTKWAFNQDRIPPSYLNAMTACEGKKVIGWGEERKYPMFSTNHVFWSYLAPPLIWKLSRDAHTTERMTIRMKQLGVKYMLVNYISLATQHQFADGFMWRDAQLKRANDFLNKKAPLVWEGKIKDEGGQYELRSL